MKQEAPVIEMHIGITAQDRSVVVRELNALLADEYILYTKTRNYHWNVKGMHFNDLHKFFEAQFTQINGIIDEVAERIPTLGGLAVSTLTEFVANARLKEEPTAQLTDKQMLANLLTDQETIIRMYRAAAELTLEHNDAATNNFLVDLMGRHEKMAWMLRAFLQ